MSKAIEFVIIMHIRVFITVEFQNNLQVIYISELYKTTLRVINDHHTYLYDTKKIDSSII